MFILNFHNLHANDEVDSASKEHIAFLQHYIDQGVFVVAGAKVPRTGGIIVAQGVERSAVEAIVANAPFVKLGHATVEITEFRAYFSGDALKLAPIEVVELKK
jgi:uncharacterized protein YciI